MDERIKVYEDKMTKTLDNLDREYTGIRAGRANPHLLDKIVVQALPEVRVCPILPYDEPGSPSSSYIC